MSTYAIDDIESIARYLKELQAEKDLALKGTSAPVSGQEPKTEPTSWYGHDYDPA